MRNDDGKELNIMEAQWIGRLYALYNDGMTMNQLLDIVNDCWLDEMRQLYQERYRAKHKVD